MKSEDRLDEKLKYCELFSFYGNLLTDRQKDIFQLYYYQDLSLGEISTELSISRQAVHDAIHKSQKLLYLYEKQLSFYAMFCKRDHYRKIIKEEMTNIAEIINESKLSERIDDLNKKIHNVNRLLDLLE